MRSVTSAKLFGAYIKLFHARKQCRAIDAQACGSSIVPTNASLTFRQCAHDLLALLLVVFVSNTSSAVERVDGFFHDPRNLVTVLRRCHRPWFVYATSA